MASFQFAAQSAVMFIVLVLVAMVVALVCLHRDERKQWSEERRDWAQRVDALTEALVRQGGAQLRMRREQTEAEKNWRSPSWFGKRRGLPVVVVPPKQGEL